MAMNNQNLVGFADYVGKLIMDNAELQAYAQEKFDKNIKVVLGSPQNYLPKVEDCPYILLSDLQKNEGITKSKCQYATMADMGIYTEDGVLVREGMPEILAGQKYLADIMELVQAALYADCKPPTSVEAYTPTLEGANPNFYAGSMCFIWDVDVPIGVTNHF